MERYAIICTCTGPGFAGQLVAVIDVSDMGRSVVTTESVAAPGNRNRHGDVIHHRLECAECGISVEWSETTLNRFLHHLKLAAIRGELSIIDMPAPDLRRPVRRIDARSAGRRYVIPLSTVAAATSKHLFS